jgi:hypothetical protein
MPKYGIVGILLVLFEGNGFMRFVLRLLRNGFCKVVPFVVCICILACPLSAYALNADLVEHETYWIDCDNQIIYKSSTFNGFTKYVVDENEGSFYLFSMFTDSKLDKACQENITFTFTIKNDVNTYYLQVDKNGMLNTSSKNSADAIELCYNFDDASCKRQGGSVFVALGLKNSTDRQLTNHISCEYSCGLSNTYVMFDDIDLDMYVPTTTKQSKEKSATQSTTKSKATKQSTTAKSTTEKSTTAKSTTQSTTKFVASGSVSSTTSTTEFVADTTADETYYTTGLATTVSNSTDGAYTYYQNDATEDYNNSLGASVFIFCVIVLAFGTAMYVAGKVNKKRVQEQNKAQQTINQLFEELNQGIQDSINSSENK